MLLAAVADDHGVLERLLERATGGVPRLQVAVRRGNGFLAVTSGYPAASVNEAAGSAIEGWSEPMAEPSVSALRETRGDFAMLALRYGGVLTGSGMAGGYRPIYVVMPGPVVMASTHLAPLLALLGSRPALDLDFLAAGLAVISGRPTQTPFLGVRRVPMGESWLLRSRQEPERLPTKRGMRERETASGDVERATLLRDVLETAVRGATTGEARVAVALSGGIDSSSITALACQLVRTGKTPAGLGALSIVYEGDPAWDDRPYRRSLAHQLGIAIEDVPPEEGAHLVRRLLVVDARPCRAAVIGVWAALAARARRGGAGVLLSGEGGDDIFNGDVGMFGALARQGQPLGALRSFVRLKAIRGSPYSRARAGILFALSPLQPRALRFARRRRMLRALYPWAGTRLLEHLDEIAEIEAARPRLAIDACPSERYDSLLSMRIFSDFGAVRAQTEIAGNLVRREPFLDDEVLRFVATVPPLTLFHGGFQRGLLREAMRGLLPEDLRLRESKSYMEPALVSLMAPVGGLRLIEDLVDVRMLADLKLVNPRAFRAHFEAVLCEPSTVGSVRLWAVVAAEAFLRQYESESVRRGRELLDHAC